MNQSDFTLSSPLLPQGQQQRPMLCLTLVWHPDLARVGEQYIATDDVFELARYLPLFQMPDKPGLSLGHGGISREPLRLVRDADDNLSIIPPNSRMVVELHGREIREPQILSRAQLEAGVMLGLGRAVLICLHFMRCLPKHNPVDGLIGVGEAAIKTRDLIRQVARLDTAVLLLGETGTGKEVAARALHALSPRASKAMVSVNMAALNEDLAAADLFGAVKGAYTGAQNTRGGLFQEAQDATLFMDEIGNAPAPIQPMLLRVLETGDYRPLGATRDQQTNARLIAATDQDLYGGNFNQALLRRLESVIIHIPPLRTRREDIGLLIVHLLNNSTLPGTACTTLPAALVSQLANYDWPGNVRQLKHVVNRILLGLQMGDLPAFAALVDARPTQVPISHQATATLVLPANAAGHGSEADVSPLPERKKLAEISETEVLQAMVNHDWYIQGAAQELGISRPSLYKLLDAHSQIRRPEQIAQEEIMQALQDSIGNVEQCAARLKTPSEALRRHLRQLALLH